jgi:hypothetical protein
MRSRAVIELSVGNLSVAVRIRALDSSAEVLAARQRRIVTSDSVVA